MKVNAETYASEATATVGFADFFFVVLRHLYSLLVVLQYSAPDSPPNDPSLEGRGMWKGCYE